MNRRVRLALLVSALIVPSIGCIPPDALNSPLIGQLTGAKVDEALSAQTVSDGIEGFRSAAAALEGTLFVVLTLGTALSIGLGSSPLSRSLAGWGIGAALSGVVIATIGRQEWYSIDYVLRQLGFWIAGFVKFDQDPLLGYTAIGKAVTASVSALRVALSEMTNGPGTGGPTLSKADTIATAVGTFYLSPVGANVLWWNCVCCLFLRWVLHAAYLCLICFYTMLGPLAGVSLILPSTRRIFFGYCKLYLSLALWPALFIAMERIIAAIPSILFGSIYTESVSASPYTLAVTVTQGTLVIALMNVLFFFLYLGVPVAATGFVLGSGRPFRNR
jgi:hypothetical protein